MIWLAAYLACFGLYPFADPGHDDLGSDMVQLDLLVHAAAIAYLVSRAARRVR